MWLSQSWQLQRHSVRLHIYCNCILRLYCCSADVPHTIVSRRHRRICALPFSAFSEWNRMALAKKLKFYECLLAWMSWNWLVLVSWALAGDGILYIIWCWLTPTNFTTYLILNARRTWGLSIISDLHAWRVTLLALLGRKRVSIFVYMVAVSVVKLQNILCTP